LSIGTSEAVFEAVGYQVVIYHQCLPNTKHGANFQMQIEVKLAAILVLAYKHINENSLWLWHNCHQARSPISVCSVTFNFAPSIVT
jgi:hypothetical protein